MKDNDGIMTKEYEDGTLFFTSYNGGQLGIFLSKPDPEDMPDELRDKIGEIKAERGDDTQAFGASVDIAFRRSPDDRWGKCSAKDHAGIGKLMESSFVGKEQLPGDGEEIKDAHVAMGRVIRSVLLAYVQGGLS